VINPGDARQIWLRWINTELEQREVTTLDMSQEEYAALQNRENESTDTLRALADRISKCPRRKQRR
jgi:hypothetical protein